MVALERLLGQQIRFDSTPSQSAAFTNDELAVKVEEKPSGVTEWDEAQSDECIVEEKRALAEAKMREMAEQYKKAFNHSSWVPNEPADKDTAFAPWKLVVLYPTCFIGKTNRPLVSSIYDKYLWVLG